MIIPNAIQPIIIRTIMASVYWSSRIHIVDLLMNIPMVDSVNVYWEDGNALHPPNVIGLSEWQYNVEKFLTIARRLDITDDSLSAI